MRTHARRNRTFFQAAFYEDRGTQTIENEDKSKEEPHEDLMNKPSLVKFMTRAAPMIITELDAALRSRAFDGYSLIEDEQDKQVRKVHTLEHGRSEGIRVSGVSWSMAGMLIKISLVTQERIVSKYRF